MRPIKNFVILDKIFAHLKSMCAIVGVSSCWSYRNSSKVSIFQLFMCVPDTKLEVWVFEKRWKENFFAKNPKNWPCKNCYNFLRSFAPEPSVSAASVFAFAASPTVLGEATCPANFFTPKASSSDGCVIASNLTPLLRPRSPPLPDGGYKTLIELAFCRSGVETEDNKAMHKSWTERKK